MGCDAVCSQELLAHNNFEPFSSTFWQILSPFNVFLFNCGTLLVHKTCVELNMNMNMDNNLSTGRCLKFLFEISLARESVL